MEKKEEYREEEGYDMCRALREMMEESKEEGKREGLRILIQENHDEGVSEERIVEKLRKYYAMSEDEAWAAIKEFEK